MKRCEKKPYVLPDGAVVIGKRIYRKCPECGDYVWTNKPLFGSLHICTESVK